MDQSYDRSSNAYSQEFALRKLAFLDACDQGGDVGEHGAIGLWSLTELELYATLLSCLLDRVRPNVLPAGPQLHLGREAAPTR